MATEAYENLMLCSCKDGKHGGDDPNCKCVGCKVDKDIEAAIRLAAAKEQEEIEVEIFEPMPFEEP